VKRKKQTQEQIETILRYRQEGFSYSKIERLMKDSGISRRIAQKIVQEWEESRSIRQLEDVRSKVGESEHKDHLDTLTTYAIQLVDYLVLPEYPDFDMDFATFHSNLIERDIIGFTEHQSPSVPEERKVERIRRQNRHLFESLESHTGDIIDWRVLQAWVSERLNCNRVLPDFEKLVGKTTENILNPFPEPDLWITGAYNEEKIFEILEKELLHVAWKGIVAGEKDAAHELIITKDVGEDRVTRPRVIVGGHTFVQQTGNKISAPFVERVRNILDQTWESNEARELLLAAGRMQVVATELEEKLDPLALRPHLLRTKCKLCPA